MIVLPVAWCEGGAQGEGGVARQSYYIITVKTKRKMVTSPFKFSFVFFFFFSKLPNIRHVCKTKLGTRNKNKFISHPDKQHTVSFSSCHISFLCAYFENKTNPGFICSSTWTSEDELHQRKMVFGSNRIQNRRKGNTFYEIQHNLFFIDLNYSCGDEIF